jgi:hypothetical protein
MQAAEYRELLAGGADIAAAAIGRGAPTNGAEPEPGAAGPTRSGNGAGPAREGAATVD